MQATSSSYDMIWYDMIWYQAREHESSLVEPWRLCWCPMHIYLVSLYIPTYCTISSTLPHPTNRKPLSSFVRTQEQASHISTNHKTRHDTRFSLSDQHYAYHCSMMTHTIFSLSFSSQTTYKQADTHTHTNRSLHTYNSEKSLFLSLNDT